jgi:hypothetical protein
MTVVYTACSLTAAAYALRSNTRVAAAFLALGVLSWTWVEYQVHRFILHGRFPDGPGLRHVAHKLFDHLHVEHHERPWDGSHINGTLRDTGWLLGPAALVGLALPPHTFLAFLAGLVQAYVAEEWVHHSVHFYHFDNLYFRYIKRHHLYHHSGRGHDHGFGLTNGLWDVVYRTRFPAEVRRSLYRGLRRGRVSTGEEPVRARWGPSALS